ncbi:hypothetical protein A2U01_0061098, partial [Trifolium medium]|nr:hypothetical protein [Trifolium medium]
AGNGGAIIVIVAGEGCLQALIVLKVGYLLDLELFHEPC